MQKRLYSDDKFNIETIAIVLRYYANSSDSLTFDEWKKVVGRYNAKNEKYQIEYSNYVYEYLDPIREYLN